MYRLLASSVWLVSMGGVYKLAFVDTMVLSVIFEMISNVFSVVVSLDGVTSWPL